MMTTPEMIGTEPSDAVLVNQSLAGNREAFEGIVTRYQSLICALAYSATGSLGQSEDLAQETFVIAWRKLADLREPAKLRSWLCGIVRRLVGKALRRDVREPIHAAASLEYAHELATVEPLPSDYTISREEESILWRSLESIPELYREPLVLFYREQQSVGWVADALELTEDAVKQRLSRGRKLLHEQVLAVVEGALARTKPGKAFTLGVLASLPVFAASASAATIGATAAKGSAAAKASALMGFSGAILGPIIGILGGWLGVKASLANATSEKERRLIRRFTWFVVALVICSLAVLGALITAVHGFDQVSPKLLAGTVIGFSILYMGVLFALIFRFNHLQRRVRQEAASDGTVAAVQAGQRAVFRPLDYRSRWTLLGLPLLHVRLGRRPEEKLRPALGWIAIGDFAVGVLFAGGGISIGGISLGGAALGIVTFGGAALGALAVGGLAIGGWAIGGATLGYLALGGCAVAWHAALGGLAVAKHLAVGGVVHAQHANDAAAKAFIDSHAFFQKGMQSMQHGSWLMLLCWIPLGIVIWHLWRMRRQAANQNRA